MTFSIVGRCLTTGMFGGAVCSSSPAVGSRCLFAVSRVGAALTQNFTDPVLGRKCLELLARGATAEQAVQIVSSTAEQASYRQLAAIGVSGEPAYFTGELCMSRQGMSVGRNSVAVGNLLASETVTDSMVQAFENAEGHLAARLLAAMHDGLLAGGEIDAVHSAGLVVVHDLAWPVVDLRVDWTDGDPIVDLDVLWKRWEVVMPTYLARALSPQTAPQTDGVQP